MKHIADRFVVVLDANVLFPFRKRDVLLRFCEAGLFRARWSPQILDEWTRCHRSINQQRYDAPLDDTVHAALRVTSSGSRNRQTPSPRRPTAMAAERTRPRVIPSAAGRRKIGGRQNRSAFPAKTEVLQFCCRG